MRILSGVTAVFLSCAAAASAQSDGSAILVLDGSGSMWGQIDGTAKITIAQDVVAELLDDLPATQSLGLTVYGHRRKGDCSDIETLVMPGIGTRAAIGSAVRAVKPKGKTPMTDAVIAAAKALRYTEEKATVILVSDGIETCAPDPCAAARVLEETGVDFTAHVVGFDVTDAKALAQMQCIADETGGTFRTASNASELTEALTTAVAEPDPVPVTVSLEARLGGVTGTLVTGTFLWDLSGPEGTVLSDAEGNPVSQHLLPGAYSVRATWLEQELDGALDVTISDAAQQSVVVTFSLPDPTATITAPQSAVAGTQIDVGWDGPNDTNDNIQIARTDEGFLQYTYTAKGNPLKLQMPAEPGAYELRYVWQDRQTIATVPITVTEAPLSLTAPDSIPGGSALSVMWEGPDANGDNVQIGPVGGSFTDYMYTKRGNPVSLTVPFHPGEYELRYRFQDRETILTRPITVTKAPVALTAPPTIAAGADFQVTWEGPDAPGDNVQIAEIGGRYLGYSYTKRGNPVTLTAPDAPGQYELRYSFRDRETVHTVPITVE